MSHYHWLIYLYEQKTQEGSFVNSTYFDVTADTLMQAVKKCRELIKDDPEGKRRVFHHVKQVMEHHDNHDGLVKLPEHH